MYIHTCIHVYSTCMYLLAYVCEVNSARHMFVCTAGSLYIYSYLSIYLYIYIYTNVNNLPLHTY